MKEASGIGTRLESVYACPTPAQKKTLKALDAMTPAELVQRIAFLDEVIARVDEELKGADIDADMRRWLQGRPYPAPGNGWCCRHGPRCSAPGP